MKTKRRRIVNTIIVCALLLSQLIPVASIAATTEESTSIPVSGTDTTSSTEAPLQSSTSSTFSEQQETKPEINENEVEKNYDERALEENPTTSEHPTVAIEEKKIVDDQLKLKGKVKPIKSATNQSIIKKLVLQSKVSNSSWADMKEFEINSEEALQKNEIDFNFDESTDNAENFRLIIEYEIRYFSNDLLFEINKHKAHFNITEIEQEVQDSSEQLIEESPTNPEENFDTTEPESSSSTSQPEPQKDNSSKNLTEEKSDGLTGNSVPEEKKSSNRDLKEEINNSYPSIPTNPDTENSEIEQNRARQNLSQTDRSLTTRARSDVPYPGTSFNEYYSNKVTISNIKKNSASVNVNIAGNAEINSISVRYAVISKDPNYISRSSLTLAEMQSETQKFSIDSSQSSSGTNYKSYSIPISGLEINTKYYVWLFRYRTKIPPFGEEDFYQNYAPSGTIEAISANLYKPYSFTTDDPDPLSKVSKPIFSSPEKNSIKLNRGTYTGDITQSDVGGKLEMNNGTATDIKEGIWHSKVTGNGNDKGFYASSTSSDSTTITGLTAGTKYVATMKLLKYGGTSTTASHWTPSEKNNFSTKNDPKVPETPTLNTPTVSSSEATAEFTAKYGAKKGTNGDHPSANQIEIEVADASGNLLKTLKSPNYTSGTGIRLSANPTVTNNVDDPYIKFKLRGLEANKKYKVRYKVTNSAGESSFSTYKDFKTNGIDLTINTPAFDNDKATANSIHMKQGKFTGHTYSTNTTESGSPNLTDRVRYRKQGESSWVDSSLAPLAHDITYNSTGLEEKNYGATNGNNIVELSAGSYYEVQAIMKNAEKNMVYPSNYAKKIPTRNSVSRPNDPGEGSIRTDGAAFRAYYGATKGGNGVHPTEVEVFVKKSTDNEYPETPLGTTGDGPRLKILSNEKGYQVNSNPSDRGTNIQFELIGFESNTEYDVKYKVKNLAGWSDESEETSFTTLPAAVHNIEAPNFSYEDKYVTGIRMTEGTFEGVNKENTNARIRVKEVDNEGRPLESSDDLEEQIKASDINVNHETGKYNFTTGNEGRTIEVENEQPKPTGKRYIARIEIQHPYNENEWVKSSWSSFTTFNYCGRPQDQDSSPGEPNPNQPIPNSTYEAKLNIWGYYGGPNDASVSHPKEGIDNLNQGILSGYEVQITTVPNSQNDSDYTTLRVNSASGPSLEAIPVRGDYNVSQTGYPFYYAIKGLQSNKTYYVRHRLKNDNNQWSKWSSVGTYTTKSMSSGLHLTNVPSLFDFGMLETSPTVTETGLFSNGQTNNEDLTLGIENNGISQGWQLSAKFEGLEENDGPTRLDGCSISFDRQLQKTTDGTTWSNVTSGFDGLEESTNLFANGESKTLWKPNTQSTVSDREGIFRGSIPFNSVKIRIPPTNNSHKGKQYNGKITWMLESLP